MAAKTKLSNDERIKKFLETEDWSVLEGEPLYFGKRDGNLGGMWCKYVVPSCLLSCGISACFAPMQCCCPSTVYEKYDGVYVRCRLGRLPGCLRQRGSVAYLALVVSMGTPQRAPRPPNLAAPPAPTLIAAGPGGGVGLGGHEHLLLQHQTGAEQ